MPENVKTDQKNIKWVKSDGWLYRSHNARSKSFCPKCAHQKKLKDKSEQKDANGVIWGSGQVQMKIFEQGCQTCGTYRSGCLDQEGIEQAFYWLHIWLLKKFYNVEIYGDDCSDQPKDERFSRGPHDSKRSVAHCSSTIQNVDMICVLHNGVILAIESYEDLLTVDGRYYRLIQEKLT
ncbi:unnamed protein product [Rotaria sp. Silwood1]|nr:unnamed protein product [Rotaria sp. Silwood1]